MTDDRANAPRTPSLRHLEQLMHGLTAGVILVDPSGALIGANPAALRMHGVRDVKELGTTADGYCARFSLRYRNHHRLTKRANIRSCACWPARVSPISSSRSRRSAPTNRAGRTRSTTS